MCIGKIAQTWQEPSRSDRKCSQETEAHPPYFLVQSEMAQNECRTWAKLPCRNSLMRVATSWFPGMQDLPLKRREGEASAPPNSIRHRRSDVPSFRQPAVQS